MKTAIIKLIINSPFEPLGWKVWNMIQGYLYPKARKYNEQTFQIMARVLKNDSNCVDVGCHLGSVLREILRFSPQGNHFAFEPIPEYARILKDKYRQVSVYELALSDSEGERTFCHVVGDPGYSGFPRQNDPRRKSVVKEIKVRTGLLDRIVPEQTRIDFIKVDVEGAELEVFRGGLRTIRNNQPVIVFEHGSFSASFGTKPEMIYELLVDRCGLNISVLSDWLEGKPPLTLEAFISSARTHHYFIAHP